MKSTKRQSPPVRYRFEFVRPLWPYLAPLYAVRSILYGLVFIAYLLFVHPLLLNGLGDARESGQPNFWLGLAIVIFLLFEIIGIRIRWPVAVERFRRWPAESYAGTIAAGMTTLAHVGLSFFIWLNIMPIFRLGIDDDATAVSLLITMLTFVVMLVKEGVVLESFGGGKKKHALLDLDEPLVKMREMVGDFFLLVFGMAAFTLSWDALVMTMQPAEVKWQGFIFGAFLFMLFYLPARLVFFAEEWMVRQPLANRIISGLFLFVAMLVAIFEVPGMR
jgi:hypothetical protein